MWIQRRAKVVRAPESVVADAAETDTGILPCSMLGCTERTGIACEHVDRRSRLCHTAWCPDHRHAIAGHAYCAIHASHHAGIPALLTERSAAVISWFAAAAEDDVVAFLNEVARRTGGMVEAESMRVTGDARGRTWQRAWRVKTTEGHGLRIFVGTGEETSEVITLGIDAEAIRMIPLPLSQLDRAPARVDLEWLLHEVVAPLRFAMGVRSANVDAALSGASYGAAVATGADRWRWL